MHAVLIVCFRLDLAALRIGAAPITEGRTGLSGCRTSLALALVVSAHLTLSFLIPASSLLVEVLVVGALSTMTLLGIDVTGADISLAQGALRTHPWPSDGRSCWY
jgi:hypothetical protein